jgi:hypoxanthine phosphoribosyltransferase
MKNIKGQQQLTLLYDSATIARAVTVLAGRINCDYQGLNPVIVGILKGSFIFLSDLVRQLNISPQIDFICLSSYQKEVYSSGIVRMHMEPRIKVEGRHVLLVEDILDSGLTTSYALKYFHGKQPASLKICTLLEKQMERKTKLKADYSGLVAPDSFIVGYGLDWAENFRNLPDIYILGNIE